MVNKKEVELLVLLKLQHYGTSSSLRSYKYHNEQGGVDDLLSKRTSSPNKSHRVCVNIIFSDFPRFCRWRRGVYDKHECLGEHAWVTVYASRRRYRWVADRSKTVSDIPRDSD
jgi:hypothetical protein